MAQTFVQFWPPDVPLTVYAEDFDAPNELTAVNFLSLYDEAPWFADWKKLYAAPTCHGRGGGSYNYRFDAVKFAHKIAALDAGRNLRCDILIWMDADTVTHGPVTADWLEGLLSADMGWLDREHKYPECGFMMWAMPSGRRIIKQIVSCYRTGAVFQMRETHDSYVIQQIVEQAKANGELSVCSLSGDGGRKTGHPFVNGPLGSRMDHLKGEQRKRQGRTPWQDVKNPERREDYWLAHMRKVRFKQDTERGNGKIYKAGEIYIMRPDQFRHWLDRGLAELVK